MKSLILTLITFYSFSCLANDDYVERVRDLLWEQNLFPSIESPAFDEFIDDLHDLNSTDQFITAPLKYIENGLPQIDDRNYTVLRKSELVKMLQDLSILMGVYWLLKEKKADTKRIRRVLKTWFQQAWSVIRKVEKKNKLLAEYMTISMATLAYYFAEKKDYPEIAEMLNTNTPVPFSRKVLEVAEKSQRLFARAADFVVPKAVKTAYVVGAIATNLLIALGSDLGIVALIPGGLLSIFVGAELVWPAMEDINDRIKKDRVELARKGRWRLAGVENGCGNF